MQNELSSFEQFLATQKTAIPYGDFVLNIFIAATLAAILRILYVRHGRSISNREAFATNFVLLTVITVLIISIVKSSLALSLGLVGALSVIRFRTAIKEPEELTYLFLCIAIGLGLGASQVVITIIAFAIICLLILLFNFVNQTKTNLSLLQIVLSDSSGVSSQDLVDCIKKYCSSVSLSRYTESPSNLEMYLYITIDSYRDMDDMRAAIKNLHPNSEISFLENAMVC